MEGGRTQGGAHMWLEASGTDRSSVSQAPRLSRLRRSQCGKASTYRSLSIPLLRLRRSQCGKALPYRNLSNPPAAAPPLAVR